MKNRILLLSMLIAVIALNACGKITAQPAKTQGTVPNSLQIIEAAAENIIDYVPSGNWDQVGKDVTDITNAWKAYQPQAVKDGASQEIQDSMMIAIDELETAFEVKDPAATMQGSNDVSAAVIEMFALYIPNIPADIGRLDVLERQVILDIAAKNYSAAEISLAQTKSVWEEVKPSVLEHNGKDIADEFEASLAAQEAELGAGDDKALTNHARNGLEIVDSLERLY